MHSTMTPEQVELGRFFKVTVRRLEEGQAAPEMFSGAGDTEWHRMLNTLEEYSAFCTEQAGSLIGHAGNKGEGPISWVSAYEEMFGPLSKVWFTDAAGTLDTAALTRYRNTGVVVAEWDCTPTGGDGDGVAPKRREAVTR
ncbi:hypothetical protein ABT072_43975 [Streptomyces sp. NPDC002589]|uniref:hypothetical protein n=1 Tax=Streptomyces sp. NPDC002589 TaxID=3154420 RepID=UPI003329CC1B